MKLLRGAFARAASSPWSVKHRPLLHSRTILNPSSSSSSSSSSSAFYSTKEPSYRKQKPRNPEHSPLPSPSDSVSPQSATRKNVEGEEESRPEPARVSGTWAKPSEIPWQAKVANAVKLIGTVQSPLQFRADDDDKYYACTVISQGGTVAADAPPFRIPITFEGDLAHVAACHLKEKDCIYIEGQLSAVSPISDAGMNRKEVQVAVKSINFVQKGSHVKKGNPPPTQEKVAHTKSDEFKDNGDPAHSSWRDLLENPKLWADYRVDKRKGLVKPRHPDFKSKDGRPLWLNSAPSWALSGIEGLEFDTVSFKAKANESKGVEGLESNTNSFKAKANESKGVPIQKKNESKGVEGLESNTNSFKAKANESKGVPIQKKYESKDHLWKSLVENPEKWWDNRLNKLNIRGPDFTHKDTKEALWLSGSPAWANTKLPPLKSKASWVKEK